MAIIRKTKSEAELVRVLLAHHCSLRRVSYTGSLDIRGSTVLILKQISIWHGGLPCNLCSPDADPKRES